MISRAVVVLVVASGCRQLLGFEELADPNAPPSDGRPIRDGDPLQEDSAIDGPPAGCPANYTQTFGSSFYRFVGNSAIPWLNANSDCVNDGTNTHLVVLAGDAELIAVRGFVINGNNIWIGLSDRAAANTFVPVTDEPTNYPPAKGSPWGAGEPDLDSNEDCVQLTVDGSLEDIACGNGRNYICECDDFASDPNNF